MFFIQDTEIKMPPPSTIGRLTFTKDPKFSNKRNIIFVSREKIKGHQSNVVVEHGKETFYLTSQSKIHWNTNKSALCLKTAIIANSLFISNFWKQGKPDHSLEERTCAGCQLRYWDRKTHRASDLHISNHKPGRSSKVEQNLQLLHNNQKASSLVLKTNKQNPRQQFQLFNNTDATIEVDILEAEINSGNISLNTTTSFCHQYSGWNNLRGEEKITLPKGSMSKLKIEVTGEENSAASTFFQIRCEYYLIHKGERGLRKAVVFPITVFHNIEDLDFDCSSETRNPKDWQTIDTNRVNETKPTNSKDFLCRIKSDQGRDNTYDEAENMFSNNKNSHSKPWENGKAHESITKIFDETPEITTKRNCSNKWSHISNLERRHEIKSRKVIEGIATADDPSCTSRNLILRVGIEKLLTNRISKCDGVIINRGGLKVHGVITEMGNTETKITVQNPISFPQPCKITLSANMNYHTYRVQETIVEQLNDLNGHSINYLFPTTTCKDSNSDEVQIEEDTIHITYYQELNKEQRKGTKDILNHNKNSSVLVTGSAGSGKSKLAIEVIIQLVLRGYKVLFTCPNNTNLNSFSRKIKEAFLRFHIKKRIVKISSTTAPVDPHCIIYKCYLNEDKSAHVFPPADDIMKSDVILCTPQMSVRLRQMITPDGKPVDKFLSAVIVDEVPFTASITAMTPIVSQLFQNERNIKVVLLGDNNQLTYTPRSEIGQARVGPDLLTRLLNDPHYTEGNGIHIQLTKNYRNPTLTVHIMNRLLYKDSILAGNPNPGVFDAIHVDSQYKTMIGNSNYSLAEAQSTIKIAMEATGTKKIIVLYKAQECLILRLLAKHKITNIQVCTAECAQGEEADTIIVSPTIRYANSPWHDNVKRIVMILSRTKSRFVLVGDLTLLIESRVFRTILTVCHLFGNITAPPVVRSLLTSVFRKTKDLAEDFI